MNIRILDLKAKKLILSPSERERKDTDEDAFRFSLTQAFSEEPITTFLIIFELLYEADQGYTLEVEYQATFEADEPITEKFRSSNYPKINAPAIAYPFLRSFVSTVTVNAGYESVLLPTVNFVELAKQQPLSSTSPDVATK